MSSVLIFFPCAVHNETFVFLPVCGRTCAVGSYVFLGVLLTLEDFETTSRPVYVCTRCCGSCFFLCVLLTREDFETTSRSVYVGTRAGGSYVFLGVLLTLEDFETTSRLVCSSICAGGSYVFLGVLLAESLVFGAFSAIKERELFYNPLTARPILSCEDRQYVNASLKSFFKPTSLALLHMLSFFLSTIVSGL